MSRGKTKAVQKERAKRKPIATSLSDAVARVDGRRRELPPSIIAVTPWPSSWKLRDWPAHVAPNSQRAAEYLIKTHLDELVELNAVTRVGREVIILGQGFAAFFAKYVSRVKGFKSGPMIAKERREAAAAAAQQETAAA